MDKSRRHDKQPGVGGRLRQRLEKMLLRTSCAATTSATAFVGHACTANATAAAASRQRQPAPPPAPPRARPRGGHAHEPRLSSRVAAAGDGSSSSCQRRRGHRQHRRRDARAVVHISIDCSSARSSVLQHSAPVAMRSKGKGAGSGRTRLPRRSPSYGYGWSWSSSSASDTDGEAGSFSSDGEEEWAAHTARSSTLFSSDSASDLYGTTNNHGGSGGGGTRPRRRKKKLPPPPPPPLPRRAPSRAKPSAAADAFWTPFGEHRGKKEEEERKPGDGSWDVGNAVAAAAAGSTAVVKRSRNPYADFRTSMAEMVAGRRIRGADALSELLLWYLSLNSPRHHPAILAAFEDVWEAVLGSEP